MYDLWHEDEDIKVQLEHDGGFIFLHVLVFKWSVSRVKKFRRLLVELKKQMCESGHSHIYAYNAQQNDKWFRFVESMGFRPHVVHNGLIVYKVKTHGDR